MAVLIRLLKLPGARMLGLLQSEAQLNGLLELHALELRDGRVHGVPETPAVNIARPPQLPLKPMSSANTPVVHIGAKISGTSDRHPPQVPKAVPEWHVPFSTPGLRTLNYLGLQFEGSVQGKLQRIG